ncbi:MAG: DsbA family protein [Paracoccaceae bacterium]
MKRLTTAALLIGLATPVAAFDLTAMSDAERQAFRDEVRSYLLDNPEVLMEAIGVLEKRQAETQVSNDQTLIQANSDALFNDGYSYVGGNLEGDVTMVEFLDYQCGYCKKAHPEVTELIKGDGNIRYIVKEFPILGDASVLAARFAISVKQVAGDEAYAAVHDELMTFRGEISKESLETVATSRGLDADAIMAAMDSDAVTEVISQNHALAQRMQINGTPGFVIGDQMLRGYVPLDGMQQVVAQIRGE